MLVVVRTLSLALTSRHSAPVSMMLSATTKPHRVQQTVPRISGKVQGGQSPPILSHLVGSWMAGGRQAEAARRVVHSHRSVITRVGVSCGRGPAHSACGPHSGQRWTPSWLKHRAANCCTSRLLSFFLGGSPADQDMAMATGGAEPPPPPPPPPPPTAWYSFWLACVRCESEKPGMLSGGSAIWRLRVLSRCWRCSCSQEPLGTGAFWFKPAEVAAGRRAILWDGRELKRGRLPGTCPGRVPVYTVYNTLPMRCTMGNSTKDPYLCR